MQVNRRNVLRAAAGAVAATAVDAVATACGADTPASPQSEPKPAASAATSPSQPTPAASGGARPAATLPANLPAEISSGPSARQAVALTFHGQGEPAIVESLLREIKAGGARVTVLAVGSWLRERPELARLVLDDGHELGNHTENHLAIATMSPAKAYAEINGCASELKRLTGSIGLWFRPSQTQYSTPTIRTQAAKVGYRTVLSYDLDSLDYTNPGGPAVVRNVLRAVRPGSIVSMHFGYQSTVAAMPALLDGLRRKGLKAVGMSDLIA